MGYCEYSDLNKTWIFDLDGTILKHNGYKNGGDVLLPGVIEFFTNIKDDDRVIILTARSSSFKEETEKFLNENNIRYDLIVYNLPVGERIIFNDMKPSGLKTAYAYNLKRDEGL